MISWNFQISQNTHPLHEKHANEVMSLSRLIYRNSREPRQQNLINRFVIHDLVSRIGVMISLARFSFSDRTPLRMPICRGLSQRSTRKIARLTSSSRRGSLPSRWNCRKLLSSAFLYLTSPRQS